MMGDEWGTELRRALTEPEPPRGERPLAITYDGEFAFVTEASGAQRVNWKAPYDEVAAYAEHCGLVLTDQAHYVAVWKRRVA